ncbi:hypothetical protein [Zhongshania sp.]|uniref:hypothetical protein n=2 Tax=Zhongshania sp. TaxID=1971902 RepID=UPI003564CAD7
MKGHRSRLPKLIAMLLRWHARIGMLVGLAIIGWGLSGLSHPIISRIQPVADAFVYKLDAIPSENLLSIAEATDRAGIIGAASAARLLAWLARPCYRLVVAGDVIWLDAGTAELIPRGEQDYAVHLARHYLGDQQSAIQSVTLQTEFDDDYVYVNRLLPVWRVNFARDDGMRVYVDTASDRLGTMVNNTKAMTGTFFRNVHSWVFIENTTLRLSLMSFCLLGGGLIALAGMLQYYLQWRAGRGWRQHSRLLRLHRSLGLLVAITAVTFTGSGLYHLWQKQFLPSTASVPPMAVALNKLAVDWSRLSPALVQADLINIGDEYYFRVWAGGELQYRNAANGELLADGEAAHARAIAQAYMPVDAPLLAMRSVTTFAGEYGFVNKRLPVIALDYDNTEHLSVYVEPRSGALAAVVRDSDRREGMSFSVFHKWHFIDGLGRTVRDSISAFFAAAIALVFALGMSVYIRRVRRRLR